MRSKECKIFFGAFELFFVIVITMVLIPNECAANNHTKKPYSLYHIVYKYLDAHEWFYRWITDDSCYRFNNNVTTLLHFNNVTNNVSLINLIEFKTLDIPKISLIIPSSDLKYGLIRYNASGDWETIPTAQYKIVKFKTKEIYDVGNNNFLQEVDWSPQGHSLVYVYKLDLYYLASPETPNARRLTLDGLAGKISNGLSEDAGYGPANVVFIRFSPDGKYLAFSKYNATQVKTYDYFAYGDLGNIKEQSPKVRKIKYAKVGAALPQISLFVVDLKNSNSQPKITYPLHLDELLWDIVWPTKDEVSFYISNRIQNRAWVVRCDLHNLCTKESTFFEANGWLEFDPLRYSSDGNRSLFILPAPEGNDTYNHLVMINIKNNLSTRLTFGKRMVLQVYHWDETNHLVYYQSSIEDFPSREHVYVVNTLSLEDTCLTCNFLTPSGPCLNGDASFSRKGSYYAKICKGPGPDYVVITDGKNLTYECIKNDQLWWLEDLLQPIKKDLVVPIADGYNARVRIYFPPEYNETSGTKYPTLVFVYGAPSTNEISDRYDSGSFWSRDFYVTERKYIWVVIDARGSGREGRNKMFEVYRRLGTVEVEDQINVTRYLQQSIPGIDANNTGILGGSYGGFVAAMALAKDTTGVFKFAISLAPVTNLIHHLAMWSEKFMGLPTEDDNLKGYKDTDISAIARNFSGKSFYLIHGTADQNVNFQHSMILAKALQRQYVPFEMMILPDKGHNLNVKPLDVVCVIFEYINYEFNTTNKLIPN